MATEFSHSARDDDAQRRPIPAHEVRETETVETAESVAETAESVAETAERVEGNVTAGELSRFELSPSEEEAAARLARPNPWGISALIELSSLAGGIRWPVLLFAAALVYILPVLPVERSPAALAFALGCVIVSARLASIRLEGHSPRVGIQSVCLVLAVGFGIVGLVAGISVSIALAYGAADLAAIGNALLVLAVAVLGVLGSVWLISAWMWHQCQRHRARRRKRD